MTQSEAQTNTTAQEKAAELAARLRSGEKIPLTELVQFLELSQKRVNATVRMAVKPKTVTDVDFF